MELNIRQVLMNTLSPNNEIRNEAERLLKKHRNDENVLLRVYELSVGDCDAMVRHVAIVYLASVFEGFDDDESSRFCSDKTVSNFNSSTNSLSFNSSSADYKHGNNNSALTKVCEIMVPNVLEDLHRNVNGYYDGIVRIMRVLGREEKYAFTIKGQIVDYLFGSEDRDRRLAALIGLGTVYKRRRGSVKSDESDNAKSVSIEQFVIYDNYEKFIGICADAIKSGDYALSRAWMKFVRNVYTESYVDGRECRKYVDGCREIPCGYFDVALAIASMDGDVYDDNFEKMQKWAVRFSCDYMLGVLRYGNNNTDGDDKTLCKRLFEMFEGLFDRYRAEDMLDSACIECVANFCTRLTDHRNSRGVVVDNRRMLIDKLILPVHFFNGKIKDAFECNRKDYLNGRYNFVDNDIIAAVSGLFGAMLNMNDTVSRSVFSDLMNYFDFSFNSSNMIDSASYQYAVIGILAGNQDGLKRLLMSIENPDMSSNNSNSSTSNNMNRFSFVLNGSIISSYEEFVTNVIFKALHSNREELISQSLYFLSMGETNDVDKDTAILQFRYVYDIAMRRDGALSVEAVLALLFFMENIHAIDEMKPYVGTMFMLIADFTRDYMLEALRAALDTLIEKFPDEVVGITPQMANHICTDIITALSKDTEQSAIAVCDYFASLDNLIMNAGAHREAVLQSYPHIYNVMDAVFSRKLYDFYQEALGIMNSLLFVLQCVDAPLVQLLNTILSSDVEQLAYYPCEVKDLVDNFFSYGKDDVVSPGLLDLLLRFMFSGVLLNYSDDLDKGAYSSDNTKSTLDRLKPNIDVDRYALEAVCRIIDSLLINTRSAEVVSRYPAFFERCVTELIHLYRIVSRDDLTAVTTLVTLMNCFSAAAQDTLKIMGPFINEFIAAIDSEHSKFKRVYDKKVLLIFVATLFTSQPIPGIAPDAINRAFVGTLDTLPQAIKNRNQLRARDDDDAEYYDEESYNYDDSDSFYDEFEEDIWFETVLDNFDVYAYITKVIKTLDPSSYGALAVSRLSQEHVTIVNNILSVEQEQQK